MGLRGGKDMAKSDIIKTNIKAEKGITFYELINKKNDYDVKDIALCRLNGEFYELNEVIDDDGDIEIIYFESETTMITTKSNEIGRASCRERV